MSYINTYWNECVEPVVYDGQPCIDQEFGKVRSAAFIRKDYLPSVLATPTNVAVWEAGVNTGKIIILPFVSGSFEPGEPVALKGYGRRLTTRGPRDMVLTFSDPAYVLNYAFYSRLHRVLDFVVAFRTSSQLHIADAPADIVTKNVVDEDLQSTVVWEARCTWRSADLPRIADASFLSSLFHSASQQSSTIVFASGYYVSLSARLVIRFQVGAAGAPMAAGDTVYTNALMAGKKLLLVADGLGLPVDDGSGAIDWTGSLVRHIEKTDASPSLTIVGGAINNEIIEIYALS
jgi:hypothetical protein